MTKEYVLDGAKIRSLEAFYNEISDKLIPDAGWGRNLDAFNDILRGGFGTPEDGFILRWTHSEISREHLGDTAFEQLVDIIRSHGPGGDESESNVQLVLESSASLGSEREMLPDWGTLTVERLLCRGEQVTNGEQPPSEALALEPHDVWRRFRDADDVIELGLSVNGDVNLSPLGKLSSLEVLELNLSDTIDISVIATLPVLRKLYIAGISINTDNSEDIANTFSRMPALRELSFYPSTYHNFTFLENVNNLEKFEYYEAINEFGFIDNSGRMQRGTRPAKDIAPIGNLKNLLTLQLGGICAKAFEPIAELAGLTELNLFGSNITDLSPLRKLNSLATLNLSLTKVTDLTPLEGLRALEELILEGVQVDSVAPLAGLENLRKIELFQYDGRVPDLSPLIKSPTPRMLGLGKGIGLKNRLKLAMASHIEVYPPSQK